MKEIILLIQALSNDYELLSENTNQIFHTLKVKDYRKKEILELETNRLYEQKNMHEQKLIFATKEKAEQLGLEDKRIETILNINTNEEEKMIVQYELDKMLININQFQFNLKRNIEFALSFMETKGKEIDVMFEAIQRENHQHNGSLLFNEEL